ncbi:unnamed protein product, partial [Prorocentrum cordatum]
KGQVRARATLRIFSLSADACGRRPAIQQQKHLVCRMRGNLFSLLSTSSQQLGSVQLNICSTFVFKPAGGAKSGLTERISNLFSLLSTSSQQLGSVQLNICSTFVFKPAGGAKSGLTERISWDKH